MSRPQLPTFDSAPVWLTADAPYRKAPQDPAHHQANTNRQTTRHGDETPTPGFSIPATIGERICPVLCLESESSNRTTGGPEAVHPTRKPTPALLGLTVELQAIYPTEHLPRHRMLVIIINVTNPKNKANAIMTMKALYASIDREGSNLHSILLESYEA